jgi:hypothetical protein
MSCRFALAFGILCLAAGTASRARADEHGPLLIGGLQGGADAQYAYFGAVQPLGGSRLGQGLFGRMVASWLGYRYDTTLNGQPMRVSARAPGVDGGFGYAAGDEVSAIEGSLSVGVRDTHLSPDDPASHNRGSRFALTPQLQARRSFSAQADADLIAAYSVGPRNSFVRGRAGWRPNAGWRIGPELAWQSGPDYRQLNTGLFAGTFPKPGVSLDFDLGRSRSRDGRTSAYAGISFSVLK